MTVPQLPLRTASALPAKAGRNIGLGDCLFRGLASDLVHVVVGICRKPQGKPSVKCNDSNRRNDKQDQIPRQARKCVTDWWGIRPGRFRWGARRGLGKR